MINCPYNLPYNLPDCQENYNEYLAIKVYYNIYQTIFHSELGNKMQFFLNVLKHLKKDYHSETDLNLINQIVAMRNGVE